LLRAVKNRYGSTDEVGCFDLNEDGIIGLEDPSSLFMTRTNQPVSGTCITVTIEGRRPLVAEVPALLAKTNNAQPRRTTSGLDSSRAAMLLAVLQARAKVDLSSVDCYLATVGGVRLTEPATDLTAALAITGSALNKALPRDLVAFGEVGLAGEVRPVPDIQRRIMEAHRLGFRQAIVPATGLPKSKVPEGFTIKEVQSVVEALAAAFPGIN